MSRLTLIADPGAGGSPILLGSLGSRLLYMCSIKDSKLLGDGMYRMIAQIPEFS